MFLSHVSPQEVPLVSGAVAVGFVLGAMVGGLAVEFLMKGLKRLRHK